MPADPGNAFNSASGATPPAPTLDRPAETPSEQVASHALGKQDGPPPPTLGGEAMARQKHVVGMGQDEQRSDAANNHSRTQSPAVTGYLENLRDKFKQAKTREIPAKTVDRNHERELGDD